MNRRDVLLATTGALPLLLASTLLAPPPPPVLVWNASASAPVGLYGIRPSAPVRVDDYAAARLPDGLAALAARRGYLARGVPLIKRVAGVRFDRVCAHGPDITINGMWVAARHRADARGRSLPWWQGCHLLADGELFLLADDRPEAFDGRYTGLTRRAAIIGKAIHLWPR